MVAMKRAMVVAGSFLLGIVLATSGSEAQFVNPPERGHRQFRDPVLAWNAIALQAVADDHSEIFGPPEQGGPTRAARALAIVHAAVYDAVNSIDRSYTPYLTLVRRRPHTDVSLAAAVAAAAHGTLVALYPSQEEVFDEALARHLAHIRHSAARRHGLEVGRTVAKQLLQARRDDGSADPKPHTPSDLPGRHRVDPLNPDQDFLTPGWGKVTPFVVQSGSQFRAPPPPALTSPEYADAYDEVKRLGGDGINTPMERTDEQTAIGLYWAYDGSRQLGPPPRLYNQIARVIAAQQDNTIVENARFFALINLAMADAGITCWESKYVYDYWRPILGIREADSGTGPTGLGDGNEETVGDPDWQPLGAPASNQSGTNFTPPFPAYPSGHAAFGAAIFRIIALFYGTDRIPFTFISDELNGVTTDNAGVVRPRLPRRFSRLSQAAAENAQSRIYLGVHWAFDATAGSAMGHAIGDYVFRHALRPVSR
jgi:hypothetical protein